MLKSSSVVEIYLKAFPDEQSHLKQLLEQISQAKGEAELADRNNFVGHITASGFVLSRHTNKILRIYHKTHKMHLQPGGHFEKGDASLLDTARREIFEETNLSNLEYIPYHYNTAIPIDIDTHAIARNPLKNEAPHYHHDFRYLFLCEDEKSTLKTDRAEIAYHEWVDLYNLHQSQTFLNITQKIQYILSREFRTHHFFYKLAATLNITAAASSVIVTHLMDGTSEYLDFINSITHISKVLPKPKSIVPAVFDVVSKKYDIVNLTRENIQSLNEAKILISSIEGRIVIFDIGGWFAPVINDLAMAYPNKIIGVIEDTENGLQKYEKQKPLQVPVFSVARSPLKENEDFLIGQSVLFSADVLLREHGVLFQYLTCSVIGYGKIGKSIAHHLLLRGVKPNVHDTKRLRSLEAYNRLCNIQTKEHIIRLSDVIFCATGSNVLNVQDFRLLKNGCFIFSVTSSDDELDLTFLEPEYKTVPVTQFITKYSSTHNYFYLANKGNAVNFIHKAVVGDFINLVRGEMVCCYAELLQGEAISDLHNLSDNKREEIADLWLSVVEDSAFK